MENFRTLNAQPISITPRLREILMELNEKRDLVIEYQTYDKEYDYSYVKSVSLQRDPEEVGENISMLFDFMIPREDWDSEYNALNGWINTLTKIGILIFQVSRIDSKMMRGCSLSSIPYPTIIINRSETTYSRIYSLLHEFAHIITQDDDNFALMTEYSNKPDLEKFVDAVAAAILIPKNQLLNDPIVKTHNSAESEMDGSRIKKIATKILG